jgi:hypothetical protein
MSPEPENRTVVALIRQRMERAGIDRRALGERLAEGGNLSKALRRVDELLRGEAFRPAVAERVASALGIPPSQLAVAREADEAVVQRRKAEEDFRLAVETMERRGPHLWGRLPPDYWPSLITVLGPESWLLVPVAAELLDLPDHEQLLEVGAIARYHYRELRRCRLVGYDYRRSLDEVFRFDSEGEFLGRFDSPLAASRWGVQVGGGVVDIPGSLARRPSAGQ